MHFRQTVEKEEREKWVIQRNQHLFGSRSPPQLEILAIISRRRPFFEFFNRLCSWSRFCSIAQYVEMKEGPSQLGPSFISTYRTIERNHLLLNSTTSNYELSEISKTILPIPLNFYTSRVAFAYKGLNGFIPNLATAIPIRSVKTLIIECPFDVHLDQLMVTTSVRFIGANLNASLNWSNHIWSSRSNQIRSYKKYLQITRKHFKFHAYAIRWFAGAKQLTNFETAR